MRSAKLAVLFGAAAALAIGGIAYCTRPSSLHLAVRAGDLRGVEREIAEGADANRGTTSLVGLSAGEPRIERETPLLAACRNNDPKIVAALLQAGADVQFDGTEGETPLSVAVRQEADTGIVAMLLRSGADPLRVALKGRTSLEWSVLYAPYGSFQACFAASRQRLNSTELARLGGLALKRQDDLKHLIHKVVERAAKGDDSGGESPTETRNAHANWKDTDGWTWLHWAAGPQGDLDGCIALLNAGADVEARTTSGYTPLMASVQSGDAARVDLLLERGARVNAVDNDMRTALHIAAWRGPQHAFELLLKHGADDSMRNKWGQTAEELLNRRNALDRKTR